MRQSRGTPRNINQTILVKATTTKRGFFSRKGYALVGAHSPQKGYAAYLSTDLLPEGYCGIEQLEYSFLKNDIQENDLVLIHPDGRVSVVWEGGCSQNGLLLTEACDCRCLMCPQPPQKHDPGLLALAREILGLLNPSDIKSLCLTGGEPALLKDQLIDLLAHIRRRFDGIPVFLLTNGKGFADFDFAKRCALASGGQVQYCVSLHADNDLDHDRIVGVPGSFEKTIKGITNLARLRMPIELRFVINRMNVDRMGQFADFAYRNFPFAVHVAFMAMEIRGLAEEHLEEIWIDPGDYGEQVRFAASRLAMRGMATSIYNMPLCLLPKAGWGLARQSISEWKNAYLPQCQGCTEQNRCSGIFTSSSRQSTQIRPIRTE